MWVVFDEVYVAGEVIDLFGEGLGVFFGVVYVFYEDVFEGYASVGFFLVVCYGIEDFIQGVYFVYGHDSCAEGVCGSV